MTTDKKADLLAGLLIGMAGLAVAAYAAGSYPLGTLRRMGPGMFPMWLGLIIALLGTVLAIGAALKLRHPLDQPRDSLGIVPRSALLATASVVAFGLLIRPAGLVVAVMAVIAISALADRTNRPLTILVLIGVLLAMALAIFHLLLGLPIPLLPQGVR